MRFVLVAILLAAGTASADDTFETRASGAVRIRHVDSLVWPFTATCDTGDDTAQRNCRRIRDTRVAELANATMLIDSEADAFKVGTYDAQKKSSAVKLTACVRCAGIAVDGRTWFVVGTKDGMPAPKWEEGRLRAGPLHDSSRLFADDAAATSYARQVSSARVQLLVKVGANAKTTVEGKNVLAVNVLGYRVYQPCDGTIVTAAPASGKAEADKKACFAKVE